MGDMWYPRLKMVISITDMQNCILPQNTAFLQQLYPSKNFLGGQRCQLYNVSTGGAISLYISPCQNWGRFGTVDIDSNLLHLTLKVLQPRWGCSTNQESNMLFSNKHPMANKVLKKRIQRTRLKHLDCSNISNINKACTSINAHV